MDFITVRQMAETLGIGFNAAKARILRRGIKPIGHVGITAIYAPEVLEQIRESAPAGRPKKDVPEEAAAATIAETGDV